jgi:biofilm protein TabA
MKKTTIFKLLLILTGSAVFLINCNSSNKLKEPSDEKTTSEWYKNEEWLNGLKLTPHESINQAEFSRQYHKNPTWWNEAFKFLKTHDLDKLSPGSYVIDSNNVIAIVSELTPKVKDSTNWEAHRNFNDLQYIVKGKAKMGIASISDPGAKVTVPYTPQDNETFSVSGGKYYDADPGTFFIFSPKEIHRPAFKIDGYNTIKKIVIKVRVP